jgi:hypothetical protein
VTGGVAYRQNAIADKPIREALGRNQPMVMLDGLSSFQIHAIAVGFGDQAIQILIGVLAGIRVNDPDTHPDAVASPGEDPGVTGRRDPAADDQYGFRLVGMRSVEVILGPDSESSEAGVEPRLFQ